MFFDPIYFLFIGPGLLLSLWASFRVKRAFNKYSKVRSARGLTGAEAAQEMLDRACRHVPILQPTRVHRWLYRLRRKRNTKGRTDQLRLALAPAGH